VQFQKVAAVHSQAKNAKREEKKPKSDEGGRSFIALCGGLCAVRQQTSGDGVGLAGWQAAGHVMVSA
jgi:hypothetical protein